MLYRCSFLDVVCFTSWTRIKYRLGFWCSLKKPHVLKSKGMRKEALKHTHRD